MLILIATMLLINFLISPSRDHVRDQLSLDDRGRMSCTASSIDGRRHEQGSGYQPQADLDLHSSDSLVACKQVIMPGGVRSARTEDILQSNSAFTEKLLQLMQEHKSWKSESWVVEVLVEQPQLNQKISFAVKTRLVEAAYKVQNRARARSTLVALGLEAWQERCAQYELNEEEARLFVFQANSLSSTLGAAACTREGWTWL